MLGVHDGSGYAVREGHDNAAHSQRPSVISQWLTPEF